MIHITTGSAKMENIFSINTSVTKNPFCQMMQKGDSICRKCYAQRNEKFRKNLVPAFEKNTVQLLSKDFQPVRIYTDIMRIHSYGELHNMKHFKNLIRLIEFNSKTMFTLWSKRANIVQDYRRAIGTIPLNMILIYSNPKIDHEKTIPPKGFDKVFNVFSKEGAQKVSINCGDKKCRDCMLCYTKNKVRVINEKIK